MDNTWALFLILSELFRIRDKPVLANIYLALSGLATITTIYRYVNEMGVI